MKADQEIKSSALKLASPREWLGLAVLALPCLLYSMDLTVLNLAVPAISADLKPSSAQLLWIVDIYGFMIAGSLITMGTLGDRIGRRKLLLLGAVAFGIASSLAAFSHSPGQLIAARALLGIAGATLAPSTLSLISNMFPDPVQRGFAIGIWTTSFSVGGAIGPVLGGVMLQYFPWGYVFLIGLPGMAVLLILGPLLLPEFKDPHSKPIDFLSAILSLSGVLAFIYGIKHGTHHGLGIISIVFILLGIFIGILFVKRQQNQTDPFMDLTLFKRPAFSASLAANTIAIFAVFGMFLFTAQFFQLVLGFSPLKSGIWMLPSSAGFILGSMLAPFLKKIARPGYIIFAGLIISAAGFLLLTLINFFDGLAMLVLGSILFSVGTSVVITLGVDMIVGVVPPERTGAASGISETSTELGGALGIAILGSIGTSIYLSGMSHVNLSQYTSEEAAAARGTIGAAMNLALRYSDSDNLALVAAAKTAFSDSFIINAGLCALLLFVIAWVALYLLRTVKLN